MAKPIPFVEPETSPRLFVSFKSIVTSSGVVCRRAGIDCGIAVRHLRRRHHYGDHTRDSLNWPHSAEDPEDEAHRSRKPFP
jgi:hypothetical protein